MPNREVYLDNSATTRPFDEVIDVMNVYFKEKYGNPSSLHFKGLEVEREIRTARETVARSLGVNSGDIYFTSGGTEANNLAIRGYVEANARKGRHLITTSIEHPSVLGVFDALKDKGFEVDYIKVDRRGIMDLEELRDKLRSDTILVSVMQVNNETGAEQPVKAISKIIKEKSAGGAFHVDAVQAYGKVPVKPDQWDIDLLTVSSHKIHGPKGVGALYVRKGTKLKPILIGGGQETAIRSGTENVPGICGFGKAVEITFRDLEQKSDRIRKLRENLKTRILEALPGSQVNTPGEESGSAYITAPHILNISFENMRAEVLLHSLETEGIYVSTGSACSSHKKAYSHVLKAMGLDDRRIEGAIRFSLSAFNSEEDMVYTVEALKRMVGKYKIPSRR